MPDSGSGGMDELAAAAAVFAMVIDSESEEEMEREANSGVSRDDRGLPNASRSQPADNANQGVHAARGEGGDASKQVMPARKKPISTPDGQPLTPYDGHASHARRIPV